MLSPELKKLKNQLEKDKDIEVDKVKLLDELKILDQYNIFVSEDINSPLYLMHPNEMVPPGWPKDIEQSTDRCKCCGRKY